MVLALAVKALNCSGLPFLVKGNAVGGGVATATCGIYVPRATLVFVMSKALTFVAAHGFRVILMLGVLTESPETYLLRDSLRERAQDRQTGNAITALEPVS